MILFHNLKNQKDWDLASQLFRSGTSIGVNVKEAQNVESSKDLFTSLKLQQKEAMNQSTG